jgi:hypothetical protein
LALSCTYALARDHSSVASGKVEELVGEKHNANPQWANPNLLLFSQVRADVPTAAPA